MDKIYVSPRTGVTYKVSDWERYPLFKEILEDYIKNEIVIGITDNVVDFAAEKAKRNK